jgi:predicted RNA-binding Zn ribbon-like protein
MNTSQTADTSSKPDAQPLSIRLVNSEWLIGMPGHGDALETTQGTLAWLQDEGLTFGRAGIKAVRAALIETRTAIRKVLDDRDDLRARRVLNEILERGSSIRKLGPNGIEETVQIEDAWRPAWLAAQDLLEQLLHVPGRIRRCENPRCTMYFVDTTKNNTRRWHDMGTCGNQAKASRHYQRSRASESTD